MRITARALNRATLGRQMLLGHESLDVVDAVRRVVASPHHQKIDELYKPHAPT